jgi:hypothetical protein
MEGIPNLSLKKKGKVFRRFSRGKLAKTTGQVRKLFCPNLSQSPVGTKEFSNLSLFFSGTKEFSSGKPPENLRDRLGHQVRKPSFSAPFFFLK